jgi:hypothetical protein
LLKPRDTDVSVAREDFASAATRISQWSTRLITSAQSQAGRPAR